MRGARIFLKSIKHPAWFAEKVYLLVRSLQVMEPQDIILASFPKTGSTWVRYFLYSLLSQKNDAVGQSLDEMNRYMPEFGNPSMLNRWVFSEAPRLIKTHRSYNLCFAKKRAVLVIRDPRDIVISYYHYAKSSKKYPFDGTLQDIIRHPEMGIEAFLSHFASWTKRAGIIIRYEDLKSSPMKYFTLIASYIGITDDTIRIERAVADSNFSSMRKAQNESSVLKKEFSDGFKFVRSGKSRQWKELFGEEDNKLFIEQSHRYNFTYYE